MNVGYSRVEWLNNNNKINNQNCPICGSNIYVSKRMDYSCVNKNCVLYSGANELIDKINSIFRMMD